MGVFRELESDEAVTLSVIRREALLEDAMTCLERWSFLVMIAGGMERMLLSLGGWEGGRWCWGPGGGVRWCIGADCEEEA